MEPNLIGRKLREIREDNNLGSLKEFAPKVGVSNNTLASYELGNVLPDVEFLINFSEETGCDFCELLDLRIESSPLLATDSEKASRYLINSAYQHLKTADTLEKTLKVMQRQENYGDSLYIDQYINVAGGMGDGIENEDMPVTLRLSVPRVEWHRYVGGSGKTIKVARGIGDSMSPTIKHGENVLIDIAVQSFVDEAIYAIMQNGLLRFKRIIMRLDGKIEIRTDNPNYAPTQPEIYSFDEYQHFDVIGRVIPMKFCLFDT